MKTSIKLVIALLGLATLALSSCNTFNGLGKDIQSAGSTLSNSANQ